MLTVCQMFFSPFSLEVGRIIVTFPHVNSRTARNFCLKFRWLFKQNFLGNILTHPKSYLKYLWFDKILISNWCSVWPINANNGPVFAFCFYLFILLVFVSFSIPLNVLRKRLLLILGTRTEEICPGYQNLWLHLIGLSKLLLYFYPVIKMFNHV